MPHNIVVWHYVGVARTVWGYMTSQTAHYQYLSFYV